MIFSSILDAVGHTPIVRLNRIGADLACALYVKCEFLNPAGSIKDRIAVGMIEAAEQAGHIRPGDTLIEATSGNTGIGLAMAAAIKGYPLIITMPQKNSHEKLTVLKALGASVHITPNLPKSHPDSYVSLAKRIHEQTERAYLINQFSNPINVETHYNTTAQEILDAFEGTPDVVVMTMGTGGTIMGVSKRLREHNPNVVIIGVDPVGSLMTGQKEKKDFLVEGIGSDFIPEIYSNHAADRIIHTEDEPSLRMARRLIREEGLLVGGSSGSAVSAMLMAASELHKGQRILAILPDSIRNYLSKFAHDAWMESHGWL